MSDQPLAETDVYPRLVGGRWVASPLTHLGMYADRALRYHESHVAVPVALLVRASGYRECGGRRTFLCDEDGPLRAPFEATCRREAGHDKDGLPDHVREHSNGYYTWPAAAVVTPPEQTGESR